MALRVGVEVGERAVLDRSVELLERADERTTRKLTSEPMNEHLNPELERLQQGINILNDLRELFSSIPTDEERQRTWRYLADRFPEFEKAKMPLWDKDKSAREPLAPVQQPSNLGHP